MSRMPLQALIPVFVALITWGHSLRYDFVWDDTFFVVQNAAVQAPESWASAFTRLDAQADKADQFLVYRPLRTLHYMALYAMGGMALRPWLFHAANIAWHATVAFLLFRLSLAVLARWGSTRSEKSRAGLASAVAIGFALHPLTSEVVCWVKSLDDLMATAATLACVWAAIALPPRPKNVLWVVLLLAAALYSKVSALPLIICLPFIYRFAHSIRGRGLLAISSATTLTGLLFLVNRHAVIGQSHQVAPLSGSYGQTLIDTIATLPIYARLFLGIPPFRIDYSYLESGHALTSLPVLAGLAILICASALILLGLRRTSWRCAALGLAWAALFFAPVSNILPMMQYMAERFAYLPLIGWVLALFVTLANLIPDRARRPVLVLVCLFWCAMSLIRMPIWRDDLTLFVTSSQQSPRVERVVDNAVKAGLRQPQLALVSKPNAQSLAAASPAQWESALQTLHELDRLFPDHELVQNATGMAHALRQRPAEAVPYFERAHALRPSRSSYRDNLIKANFDAGHIDHVIALARPDMTNTAPSQLALQNLAAAYWQQDEWAQATQVWQRLSQLDPHSGKWDQWVERARANIESAPMQSPPESDLVFVYIHGFGGEKEKPEFCKNLRAFLKKKSLSNRVINYQWDSVKIELLKAGATWREAEEHADAEAAAFKSTLIDVLEAQGTPYVLIGFSVGTRVLLRALEASAGELNMLQDVYFLGSAMPRDADLDIAALPHGRKIVNYHSPKWDIVHQAAFSFMNRLDAGGQDGFNSTNVFDNMAVSCTHTHKGIGLPIDYSQLAVAIAYIALYKDGVTLPGNTSLNMATPVGDGDLWWNKVLRVQPEVEGATLNIDIEQHTVSADYFRAVLVSQDGRRRRISRGHNMHAILKDVGVKLPQSAP